MCFVIQWKRRGSARFGGEKGPTTTMGTTRRRQANAIVDFDQNNPNWYGLGGEFQWAHRENFSDGFDVSDRRL